MATKAKTESPADKALGKRMDQYFGLRAKRLALEKQTEALKKQESEVQGDLVVRLGKLGVDSARCSKGTVSVTRPVVASVKDWPSFYAWLRRNNLLEMLQRRVSQGVVEEWFEQAAPAKKAKGIPGLERVSIVKFHATAARR